MSIQRFLSYIQYSRACPDGISPARWRGMVRWYVAEMKYAVDCEIWYVE